MTRYRCDVCNVYEYDDVKGDPDTNIKPGTKPEDFPDEWQCPICGSDKTHLFREEKYNYSEQQ
jgi:rubredoxin